MAINGQQWQGPPNTQQYIRELEKALALVQKELKAVMDAQAAQSKKR